MDLPVLLFLPTVFLLVVNGESPAYTMAPQHDHTPQNEGHDKPTPASFNRRTSDVSYSEFEQGIIRMLAVSVHNLLNLPEGLRSSYLARLLEDDAGGYHVIEELLSIENPFDVHFRRDEGNEQH